MKKRSLKFRSFLAAILALLIFIPLAAIALERAFVSSLTQSILEQLRVHSLTLITEFEFEDNNVMMPQFIYNEKLNMPESGLYAYIRLAQSQIWRSESSISMEPPTTIAAPTTGNESFESRINDDSSYFKYSYTAEFEHHGTYTPVTFHLFQSTDEFNEQLRQYRITLWYWLGIVSILLMVLLLSSLNTALRPISELVKQIRGIEKGELNQIQENYPDELEQLKTSINHLLKAEMQQRQRYKNSLGDLAHSLKTPLALLSSQENMPEATKQPLQQIQHSIARQLKRSVGADSAWLSQQPLKEITSQLIGAMTKVYADKSLAITLACEHEVKFKCDKTDVMELLGNILDNACKAAHSQITVSLKQAQDIIILVEDDGPGISELNKESLLTRGTRLDTYAEGQGIGMAVVSDLIDAYGGALDIGNSILGGARIQVTFPVEP
jgi:two-component system sensor histidine kinase PhoQ